MNEITNKHLFVTMIVIGIITILVILSQNKNLSFNTMTGYNFRSSLGASVYPAYNYTTTGNYVQKDDYWYRSNLNTTSTTYQYEVPVTPVTTTTTKYYYSYPQEQTYTSDYYNYYQGTNYQGYVPRGCESGTDYSTVDGQPCG